VRWLSDFLDLTHTVTALPGNRVVTPRVVMASCPRRHPDVNRPPRVPIRVKQDNAWRMDMWSFADRVVKAVSDVTVGTVIVLVHVVLADRRSSSRRRAVGHPVAQRLPS